MMKWIVIIGFILYGPSCGSGTNKSTIINKNTTNITTKTTSIPSYNRDKNINKLDSYTTQEYSPRKTETNKNHKREKQNIKAEEIKKEIEELMQLDHGELPGLKSVEIDDNSSPPVVKITNETDYDLTVWFAGLCAQKVTVNPHQEIELAFCPGSYILAAKLNTPHVKPFIGKDTLLEPGNKYFLTFFIMSQKQKNKENKLQQHTEKVLKEK